MEKRSAKRLKDTRYNVKAYGITHSGYPCFQMTTNNSVDLESVTLSKKKAIKVAKEWSQALDEPYKPVQVMIIYPKPKK